MQKFKKHIYSIEQTELDEKLKASDDLEEKNLDNKSKKREYQGTTGAEYHNKNTALRKKHGIQYPGNAKALAMGRKIARGDIKEEVELKENPLVGAAIRAAAPVVGRAIAGVAKWAAKNPVKATVAGTVASNAGTVSNAVKSTSDAVSNISKAAQAAKNVIGGMSTGAKAAAGAAAAGAAGAYVGNKLANKDKKKNEEVELNEISASDKKLMAQMYDKKGNLTPLGKRVMDHGKKAADAKVADKARRKEYNAYQKSKRNEEVELEEKYTASSEKSQFGGHRAHLKNPQGRTTYLSSTSYKTTKHAKGEAQAYHDGYFSGPGNANERGAERAVSAYRAKNKEHIHAKESFELDEETQYDLVEAYLLENNIDADSLTEEELNELIGKVLGGAFKVGAKAVVGAGRLSKKAVVGAGRLSKKAVMTKQGSIRGTKAAKADKAGDKAEKTAKQAERERAQRDRIRSARDRVNKARKDLENKKDKI